MPSPTNASRIDPCSPKGHECDFCKDCLAGRCCRKDDPGYRLPELGEIRPYFGRLGVLTDDGDKAECHVCGGWFGHLGGHAKRAHDLLPEEYKAAFGLNRRTGLIGPSLAAIRRKGTDHLIPYRDLGVQALKTITKEQRAQNTRQHALNRSLEAQSHYQESAARHRRIEQHECVICGREFEAVGHDANERKTCGSKECWRAVLALRGQKEVRCVICGTSWAQTSSFVRKTCSDECDSERRRRAAKRAGVLQRPEIRTRLLESIPSRQLVRDDRGRIVTWHRKG